MKNKKLIILSGVVAFLITLIVLFVLPYEGKNFKIITTKDSDAYKYAKGKSIEVETIADSEKDFYTEKKENFSYDRYQEGIVITDYHGISEELVIPRKIDGQFVLAIQKDALKNDENLTKVILPKTLLMIEKEDYQEIEIACYRSFLCEELKEDENLKVTVLSDSDFYSFTDSYLAFEYNIGDSIEIVKYTGLSRDIVIPETINGYEVTSVHLTVDKDLNSIYLPKTVNSISLDYSEKIYSPIFFFTIVMCGIALLLFIGVVIYVSLKDAQDIFYQMPVMIISYLYLIGIYGYSIYANMTNQNAKTVILVEIIVSLLYLVLSIFLLASKKRIRNYDEKIAHSTSYVQDTLELLEELDLSNYDEDIQKEIEEIKELVRYSDPVTGPKTESLEKEIQKMIQKEENTKEDWDKIKDSMQKRNRICKENK